MQFWILVSGESQAESASFESNKIGPIFDSKVREEFSLNGSTENSKYARVVKTIYQIFNTLCKNYDVSWILCSMKKKPIHLHWFYSFPNHSQIKSTIATNSEMSPIFGQSSGSKNVSSTTKLKLPSVINWTTKHLGFCSKMASKWHDHPQKSKFHCSLHTLLY